MNKTIEKELTIFEQELKTSLDIKQKYINEFLFSKSKRLRPLLAILFCKANNFNITKDHKNLFMAVELIHNASLIHDDIIDNSQQRRGNPSINKAFDNSLAVTSGDMLLAYGMQKIIQINNKEVQNLCVNNMINICNGEIKQYFAKYKLPTIEEYIEKTKEKTALLFKIGIEGGIKLSCQDIKILKIAEEFSENFGIAFQIKNDYENYITNKEDYNQGIYTAPVIYGEENGIEKTKYLINNYLDRIFKILNKLNNNEYSKSIKEIVSGLKINE